MHKTFSFTRILFNLVTKEIDMKVLSFQIIVDFSNTIGKYNAASCDFDSFDQSRK